MDSLNVKISSSENISDLNANNSSEGVNKMPNTFQSENEREHSPKNIQEFQLENGQDVQPANEKEVSPEDIQNANEKVKLFILEF